MWVSSPRSRRFFGAWRPPPGMLLGTAGPLHSLDCFLDFEEPLDDFLGFFIRWYFRASSLSGAAASPGGDGRFLGRKSRQAPSAAPGHARSLRMSPAGDRSTPASSAMEKEKGENPRPRERGQPDVPERGGARRPSMSPAAPLHLLHIAERRREPSRSHRHHPTPERAAGTPAHLPAMPSTAKRRKKNTSKIKKGRGRSYVR